ncbi:MAG: tRNA preQ1(34) S-adenosylmethionine ribosyltransferase-isomerase QueA [Steroidobacteraceae bacterium]
MRGVSLEDFDYDLPPELIAQRPLPERSASRLLEVDGASGSWRDRRFIDLPDLLQPGDLVVFNDTRVVPARLQGRKPSGGQVEMLLERALPGDQALLHMRASKPLRAGQCVLTVGGELRVLGREEDLFRVQLPAPALEFFARHGEVPLPPYITREADESDRERYQTLWASRLGAVAAPTASLHFDAPLLERLEARGIVRAQVTLHVGAGTFQPIRSSRIEEHVMHAEYGEVPAATRDAIVATRAAGKRVVAIGTTVVRALESAAHSVQQWRGIESLGPWSGDTRMFIRPGHSWRVIDSLVTNFHLPRSTLLMLVAAFVGLETIRGAYAHAVAQRYRFFSYGDAMLLTRPDNAVSQR